jgi:hypothetical protein
MRFGDPAGGEGLVQRVGDQRSLLAGRGPPAQDPARKDVENEGDVPETGHGPHVREVGYPKLINRGGRVPGAEAVARRPTRGPGRGSGPGRPAGADRRDPRGGPRPAHHESDLVRPAGAAAPGRGSARLDRPTSSTTTGSPGTASALSERAGIRPAAQMRVVNLRAWPRASPRTRGLSARLAPIAIERRWLENGTSLVTRSRRSTP